MRPASILSIPCQEVTRAFFIRSNWHGDVCYAGPAERDANTIMAWELGIWDGNEVGPAWPMPFGHQSFASRGTPFSPTKKNNAPFLRREPTTTGSERLPITTAGINIYILSHMEDHRLNILVNYNVFFVQV